jgi:hypothetical protein
MPLQKISGLVNLPAPPLPMSLAAGEVFFLPAGQGVVSAYGAQAYPQLATGNVLSGQYMLQLGLYSVLQVYDSALRYWRNLQVAPGAPIVVSSDGTNFRIANTTGCPIGGLVTAAGSGGTNGFYGYVSNVAEAPGLALGSQYVMANGVITAGNSTFNIVPSAGGSQWNAIVGGAVNTTISLSGTVFQNGAFGGTGPSATGSGGSGYTKPPIIVFTPPPNQGNQPYILPAAVCTISGGAVNSVTVTQQGAGLLGLPGITVINQPGDTAGSGAVLGWSSGNSAQVGSGTLLAAWPVFYGTAQTSVPTFTYSGGGSPGPTMTAIMNFTVTGFTNTTAGVGYVAAGGVIWGGIVSGSAANTNPLLDKALTVPVAPPINVAATTGVPSLAGPFQGYGYQAVPSYSAFSTGAAPSTAAVQPPTVGGASDTILISSL